MLSRDKSEAWIVLNHPLYWNGERPKPSVRDLTSLVRHVEYPRLHR